MDSVMKGLMENAPIIFGLEPPLTSAIQHCLIATFIAAVDDSNNYAIIRLCMGIFW